MWEGPKLGVSLGGKGFNGLSKGVTYLDLTDLTFFGHRHFNMPYLFRGAKEVELFRRLLNGEVDLTPKNLTNPSRINYGDTYGKRKKIHIGTDDIKITSNRGFAS